MSRAKFCRQLCVSGYGNVHSLIIGGHLIRVQSVRPSYQLHFLRQSPVTGMFVVSIKIVDYRVGEMVWLLFQRT